MPSIIPGPAVLLAAYMAHMSRPPGAWTHPMGCAKKSKEANPFVMSLVCVDWMRRAGGGVQGLAGFCPSRP